MDIRISITRKLPYELQEHIWKTYNNMYILPDLMDKVETILCNTEYESLLEECSETIVNVIDSLSRYNSLHDVAFSISIDFAFDRLLECGSPDLDKIALLHAIRDNISNPHLLKLTIDNTEMIDAYDCSKCTQLYVLREKLEDVYHIIMPQGGFLMELDV